MWFVGGRVPGVVPVLVVVVLAGCSGMFLGDDPLEFTATPANVSEAGLADSGYELAERSERRFNESFELAGERRRVVVTSHVATYEKSVDGAPLSSAVVVSTPRAAAFDRTLNPLAHANRTRLVRRALTDARAVEELRKVGTRSVSTLGQPADVTKYEAVTGNDSEADAVVHLLRVEDGDDLVFAAVVYPEDVDGERDALTLLRNLRH